jgi:carbon storage regulator
MLVLTRKPGEKLLIGENIAVTVVAVERGRVRLAFGAPDHVRIIRAELLDVGSRSDELDAELAAKPPEWKAPEVAPKTGPRPLAAKPRS